MRTLQEKYNGVLEGDFSKTQFRRDAATELPQFVSTVNSFEDTVSILKNKGTITEAKKEEPKYSTAKPADQIAPDVLDTGIKFELDKKYGTLDVTPEEYAKCREMAIKNLAKDVLYYVKQDSIQLEEPGEKMEKAKLNEGMSKEEAWKKFQEDNNITDKTVKVARADFEKEWAKRTDEVKVKVSIPGQDEFEAEEGKDYSEAEAEEYIENAKKHGATPMGTKFTKTDEAIQNIENDEQTKRRIAGLTNQLLKDVDPRDEDHAVKAYAISVKNDLESGDASRLKRYKDLLSIDDLKDDMRHYISHDVDQLEEDAVDENLIASDILDILNDVDRLERGEIDVKDVFTKYADHKDEPKLANFFSDLEIAAKQTDKAQANKYISSAAGEIEKLHRSLEEVVNEADIKLSAEDMEKLHKDGKLTLPNGSVLHFVGRADEDQDFTLTPDEREEQEREKFASYSTGKKSGDIGNKVHRAKSPYGPIKEERKALKEMFKKIITKVIND